MLPSSLLNQASKFATPNAAGAGPTVMLAVVAADAGSSFHR